MMFTDDDLKRLKDLIELHHVPDEWLVKRLIARLEAAERYADSKADHICQGPGPDRCEGCREEAAWRKAAGK